MLAPLISLVNTHANLTDFSGATLFGMDIQCVPLALRRCPNLEAANASRYTEYNRWSKVDINVLVAAEVPLGRNLELWAAHLQTERITCFG